MQYCGKIQILTAVISLNLAHCPAPTNGILHCPNGPTSAIGDTCTFSCNPGYQLQGSQNGTCLMGYNWSGGLRTCVPYRCPNRISTSNTTFVSLVNSTCAQTYLSQCRIYCLDGFIGEDVVYVCDITSDSTVLNWVPIGGLHSVCERGLPYKNCIYILVYMVCIGNGRHMNGCIYNREHINNNKLYFNT